MRFIEIAEYKIKLIGIHPYLGRISAENKDIRSILLTKQNRIYYRLLNGDIIEIVNIFDIRQDPQRNIFEG